MKPDLCLDDAQLLALIEQADAEPTAGAHVAVCPECRERLADLRRDMAILQDTTGDGCQPAGQSFMPPAGRPSRGLPSAIGPYRVLEWLGRGGEADVYRAEHPVLRHSVALKWSKRRYQGDAEPLVEEGRVLASLDIEGVARVFDVGVDEGRPYLVMQMLRGRTLHRYAAEAALSHRQIARLMAQVARILARAHARQIWHRDLKPSNIVVDGEGKPTVIDFGMASFCQLWQDDAPCSGGTLQFMSPEQAKNIVGVCDEQTGAVPSVGPRSDIFALGAVLYSLLTDHAPYPRSESSPELVDQVCRGGFDRLRLSARGVPKRLARICLKAMAYDPADRYATADEMARDLERFASAAKRPHWLLTSGALVAIAATTVVVGWSRFADRQPVAASQSTIAQPSSQQAEQSVVSAETPPAAHTESPAMPEAETDEKPDEDGAGEDEGKGHRPRRPNKGRTNKEKPTKTKSRSWLPRFFRGRGDP
jgi:serine/threonine protein kinase